MDALQLRMIPTAPTDSEVVVELLCYKDLKDV